MTKLAVKGYATYDKLKTCLVGRTYGREQFGHIENQKVKDILFRIFRPHQDAVGRWLVVLLSHHIFYLFP